MLAKKDINELNKFGDRIIICFNLLWIAFDFTKSILSEMDCGIFFAEAQTNPLIITNPIQMVTHDFLCLLNDKSLINGCMADTIVLHIQKKWSENHRVGSSWGWLSSGLNLTFSAHCRIVSVCFVIKYKFLAAKPFLGDSNIVFVLNVISFHQNRHYNCAIAREEILILRNEFDVPLKEWINLYKRNFCIQTINNHDSS